MDKNSDLQQLIRELINIKREYSRLAFDEEDHMRLGEPASPRQIATLEKHIGMPLPLSYRAFLELHNGWENFDGGLNLLSIEDQDSDWVKDWLKMLAMAFTAVDQENPFEKGAIPIMLGEGEHSFLIMDPRTIRKDGEMDFILFNFAEIDGRFNNFLSFLRHDLEVEQQLLENEKKGSPDEDDEEDEDED